MNLSPMGCIDFPTCLSLLLKVGDFLWTPSDIFVTLKCCGVYGNRGRAIQGKWWIGSQGLRDNTLQDFMFNYGVQLKVLCDAAKNNKTNQQFQSTVNAGTVM